MCIHFIFFAFTMLQKAVDDLYAYRDHYFENFSLECAAQKDENLKEELSKTLELIDSYKGEQKIKNVSTLN